MTATEKRHQDFVGRVHQHYGEVVATKVRQLMGKTKAGDEVIPLQLLQEAIQWHEREEVEASVRLCEMRFNSD